jgi:hypothetical protein
MSYQIWHAFYFDRAGENVPPCRSEVIEAASEEAAVRVARAHMGECQHVSLEVPRWLEHSGRVISVNNDERGGAALH